MTPQAERVIVNIIKWLFIIALAFIASEVMKAQSITGSGTSGDPYVLYNAIHIDSMRYLEGGGTNYFELGNNIDMSTDFSNWIPIGDRVVGKWDATSIDGKGYTISNLTYDTTITAYPATDYIGLFGYAGGVVGDGKPFLHDIKFDNFNFNIVGTGAGGGHLSAGLIIGEKGGNFSGDIEIDSVTVTNSILTVNYPGSSPAVIFGVGGFCGNGDNSNMARIHVEAIISVTAANGTGGVPSDDGIGGVLGSTKGYITECSFIGTLTYDNTPTTYLLGLGGIVGYFNPAVTTDSLTNCYAQISWMSSTYAMGGIIGYNVTESNTRVRNCYAVIDTADNETGGSSDSTDRDGYLVGYSESTGAIWTSCYADTEIVAWDYFGMLGFFNEDRTLVSVSEVGAPPDSAAKTTAQMKDTLIVYTDWDFTGVWDIDPGVNQGYPFHRWRIPPSSITLTYPSVNNLVFFTDSIITITWVNDIQVPNDSFALFYSTDNGIVWVSIDSTSDTDTTYSWTIPFGVQTDEALVLVRTFDSLWSDVSDTAFSIIPLQGTYTNIEIINVTPQPMLPGGGLNVFVKSTFLDTFQLFWSYDSLTWVTIEQVVVDTTNGSIFDTTQYVWDNPSVVGDFYIRALEIRNTALFFTEDTLLGVGTREATNKVCYTVTSNGVHTTQALFDVSCGWQPFVSWRYYTVLLRERSTSGAPYYISSYIMCESDIRRGIAVDTNQCKYAFTDLYEVHDTVLDSRARFTAGTEGATITVNNRRYSLSKTGSSSSGYQYFIMVEDLLNPGLTQVLVEYTSAINIGGFSAPQLQEDAGAHRLASYVKPILTWQTNADSSYAEGEATVYVMKNGTPLYDDSLHNKLLNLLGQNFGDNQEGYILVDDTLTMNTYYASILTTPAYAIPVTEDVVSVLGVTSRNYMRGIVPEAILIMRSRR